MTGQKNSRRLFLGDVTRVAAASMAAPLILPRLCAQQANGDRVPVAAIGVGGRGSEISGQAARLGRMIACCDVHQNNANRFAQRMKDRGGECQVYTDYRELLAKEKDVAAVTIGTPDHWHVKIAIEAMKAGKHVYCEKPLTLTLEEGQLIKAASRKYNKVFQVGTQQRSEFDRRFLKAVAIAHSGRLGKNLEAVSSVGRSASRSPDPNLPFGPFPAAKPPEALNWDLWQGPALETDFCSERIGWNFRWWFEYSGGQVTDWGVHHTDIAFWALAGADGQAIQAQGTAKFMGVEREKIRDFLLGKVEAKSMPQAFNVAHEFDVEIQLSTGNKIRLTSGNNELLLIGELGRIRVNRGSLTGKPVEDVDADPKAKDEIEALMAKLYGGELPSTDLGHMQNFFDGIQKGIKTVANVDDHVRAVNACHLANIAILTDRKVVFDPQAYQFPGDAEANRLMYHQRRKQYEMEA
jgi:predicted dehydrogenase